MSLVSTPYRWFWRTWYKNAAHWVWDIRNGLRNIPIFFEAVWWFRAWDYNGLLGLIETAAKEMARGHKEYGHTVNSEKTVRQLTIVFELCRRLREDNYFENAGYQSDKWKDLPDYQRTQIVKHSAAVAKNDAIYLGKQFKFVQHWWD